MPLLQSSSALKSIKIRMEFFMSLLSVNCLSFKNDLINDLMIGISSSHTAIYLSYMA